MELVNKIKQIDHAKKQPTLSKRLAALTNVDYTKYSPDNKGGLSKGFNAGGISVTRDGDIFDVTRSDALTSNLLGASTAYRDQSERLGSLINDLKPGFGKLTQAAVNSLQNRKKSAISNLRDNLAKRRVAGSSFGGDLLARAEAEFAQEESEIIAKVGLQEIEASANLIKEQAVAKSKQFEILINQSNIEANLGAQMVTGMNAAVNQAAAIAAGIQQAKLAADAQKEAAKDSATGNVIGATIGGLL